MTSNPLLSGLPDVIAAADALRAAHTEHRAAQDKDDAFIRVRQARQVLYHEIRRFLMLALHAPPQPTQGPDVPAERRAPAETFADVRDFLHGCTNYAALYNHGPLGVISSERQLLSALTRARATLGLT